MAVKRVFIIGAGFSKHAGLPLATELTGLFTEKFKEYDQNDAIEWLQHLEDLLGGLKGKQRGSYRVNYEELFDLAGIEMELWKMEQHRCPVGRMSGDTPWDMADSIESWLKQMEDDLSEIIWTQQKVAKNLDYVSLFVKQLTPNDVVVTFNYDTLIENALNDISKKYQYGFTVENGEGIQILKMHGSINWATVLRDQAKNFNYTLLFKKKDENRRDDNMPSEEEEYDCVLLQVPDSSVANRIENWVVQKGNKQYMIGIAGLGSRKPLHKLPGTGEIWYNSRKALNEADDMWIIGFSLSPFDIMARLQFAGVMRSRTEKGNLPKKITIVNPCDEDPTPNFQSVFGSEVPIKRCKKGAEEVDWSAELKR